MGQTVSEQLAAFAAGLKYEQLPSDVVRIAKERILDILAVVIGGSREGDISRQLVEQVQTFGGDQATVLGSGTRTLACFAAWCNAAFAHGLEMDDGHKFAGVHAGCVVIPAALAIAEQTKPDGKAFIEAVVAGYDVIYRLAANITPSHLKKGFHPSGNTGVYGAAAAAGKLLGLDADQMSRAFGLAGQQSAGLMEIVHSGQTCKGLVPGHAALVGVLSALLAKRGLKGGETILDGKDGFFFAMAKDVDLNSVTEDLGKTYLITDTYTKLYPTCRHMHQPVENLFAIMEENKLDYHDIKSILCRVSSIAKALSGNIVNPRNASEARFSMATACALACKYGDVSLSLLSGPALNDPEIIALAQKVTVVADAEVESYLPKVRVAIVEMETNDGARYSKFGTVMRGTPDMPVDYAALANKFRGCAAGTLSEENIARVIDLVSRTEELESLDELIGCLSVG